MPTPIRCGGIQNSKSITVGHHDSPPYLPTLKEPLHKSGVMSNLLPTLIQHEYIQIFSFVLYTVSLIFPFIADITRPCDESSNRTPGFIIDNRGNNYNKVVTIPPPTFMLVSGVDLTSKSLCLITFVSVALARPRYFLHSNFKTFTMITQGPLKRMESKPL